jgi:hypothetical protein
MVVAATVGNRYSGSMVGGPFTRSGGAPNNRSRSRSGGRARASGRSWSGPWGRARTGRSRGTQRGIGADRPRRSERLARPPGRAVGRRACGPVRDRRRPDARRVRALAATPGRLVGARGAQLRRRGARRADRRRAAAGGGQPVRRRHGRWGTGRGARRRREPPVRARRVPEGPVLGVVGVFVPLVALVAALRLARPTSPWARRRYDERRMARARRRSPPGRRTRWDRLIDVFARAPPPLTGRGPAPP